MTWRIRGASEVQMKCLIFQMSKARTLPLHTERTELGTASLTTALL